jgi:hypothetical protein
MLDAMSIMRAMPRSRPHTEDIEEVELEPNTAFMVPSVPDVRPCRRAFQIAVCGARLTLTLLGACVARCVRACACVAACAVLSRAVRHVQG